LLLFCSCFTTFWSDWFDNILFRGLIITS
jgi:hypothetical protein